MLPGSMRMLDRHEEEESDDNVTWEDQQKISTFSKLNVRMRSVDDRLDALKHEKEALDDLQTEIELADEDEPVLYKIGEAFLHMSHSKAAERLEKDQAGIDQQVSTLTADAEDTAKQMTELKAMLYSKFGKAINLDE